MDHLDKCRVCFSAVARDDVAYNLLALPNLAVKFSDCTSLVVDPEDADVIPSEICGQCYEQLEQFHEFRDLCITADRKWRVESGVENGGVTQEKPIYMEEEEEREEEEHEEEEHEEEEQEEQEEQDEQEEQEEEEAQDTKEEQEESEDNPEQPSLQAPELQNNAQRNASSKKPGKEAQEKIPAVISAPDLLYTCDICSLGFDEYKRLLSHKKEHDGHNLYQCSEAGCHASFNRYEQLRQHELEHAETGTRFICEENGCNKMYRHKASLKQHQSKAHAIGEPQKKHICEFCGRVFQNLSALTHHRYTHSDQIQLPFPCDMPDCTLRFISKEKLRIHMMRHQGIKDYSCPYCGLRKTTKQELRQHINFHTLERSWACTMCSKVCNSSTSLKKHVRTIHEKARDYACSYCEKSFANPDTRKYHEMTHTGEKNFECHECGKKFTQPAALRTHRLVHERKAEARVEPTLTFNGAPSQAMFTSPNLVVSSPLVMTPLQPLIVEPLQPAFTILQVTSLGYPTL